LIFHSGSILTQQRLGRNPGLGRLNLERFLSFRWLVIPDRNGNCVIGWSKFQTSERIDHIGVEAAAEKQFATDAPAAPPPPRQAEGTGGSSLPPGNWPGSSAVPFSCDLFGCYFPDQSWLPRLALAFFAPTGQYNVKDTTVKLRFDSKTAWRMSSAISVMNNAAVIPTITDGFRTALDQLARRASRSAITPASVNDSLHRAGDG
jgi:hypothetical protein